jgi:hypothetical protein
MGLLARVLGPSGMTHGRPPCSSLLSPQDLVPMVPNLVKTHAYDVVRNITLKCIKSMLSG